MDLFKDLETALLSKLSTLGVTPKNSNSIQDLCLAYLNASNRRISPWKRIVHHSKELIAKLPTLSPDQQKAVKTIQKAAEQGQDLTCYLSKKMMEDYNDSLFNDWKVIHFHLGHFQSGNPFVQRTDELLYGYATKDDLFLIEVFDHNGFSNQVLLQIIHDNWPHITRPFALQGLKAGPPITNSTIKQLRKHGVSYSVPLKDGTLLFPPGGGYASSGDNTTLVMLTDRFFANIRALETKIRSNPQGYISALQREATRRKTVFDSARTILDVKLIDTSIGFEVIDTVSGCRLDGWELEKNH